MRYNGNGVWLMASLMARYCGLKPGEDFRVQFAVALLKTGPAPGWVLFCGSDVPSVCLASCPHGGAEPGAVLRSKQVVIQALRFDPNPTHGFIPFLVFWNIYRTKSQ